jgi:hypothetical protein
MSISFSSCYTETINDFSTFTIQVPVFFYDKSNNRRTPSQGLDFTNLNTNAEFVKNKAKVNRAEVYQFSYWIDSLVIPGSNKPFNPAVDELMFERIRYMIMFVKPKSSAVEFSKDPNDFVLDNTIEPFIVGDFKNVKVSEYYKNPFHIVSIPDDRASEMSSTIKKQPYFFLVTEYSKYLNQPTDTIYFPWLEVRADIVIRLTVNL